MSVTFTPDCYDRNDPIGPNWEDVEDPSEVTGHFEFGWEVDPIFRVETRDVALAADALLVAAERFMLVGDSGTEHSADEEGWWREEDGGLNNATVRVDDDAAYLYTNNKDYLTHEMADAMKLILVQELTRVGVEAVISPDHTQFLYHHARSWPLREE